MLIQAGMAGAPAHEPRRAFPRCPPLTCGAKTPASIQSVLNLTLYKNTNPLFYLEYPTYLNISGLCLGCLQTSLRCLQSMDPASKTHNTM